MTLSRLLRFWTGLLMVLLLAQVPQVVSHLLGAHDDCAGECDGCPGSRPCPPTCTQGACAKVVPTVMPTEVGSVVPAPLIERTAIVVFALPLCPPLAVLPRAVFHPPRA
jgi:hypothetical protein